MTSLWRNFSDNVVANSNWSYLLISVSKIRWRVQPTAARRTAADSTRCMGSTCIARVSQQCLHENCPQMLEKEQWPPNNSPNLNGMEISCLGSRHTHEAILKPSSEAQNRFWIKSGIGEDLGQFSAGPINKLSRVLRTVWQEYVNGDGKHGIHSKYLSVFKKVFALTAFALSWIVETIFDNC